MALRDDLMSEIKEAMKAKAADRLSALRLILNGLKEREIALRGDGVARHSGSPGLLRVAPASPFSTPSPPP